MGSLLVLELNCGATTLLVTLFGNGIILVCLDDLRLFHASIQKPLSFYLALRMQSPTMNLWVSQGYECGRTGLLMPSFLKLNYPWG